MPRVVLRAVDIDVMNDEFALTCGFAVLDVESISHGLYFERISEAGAEAHPAEDWGVYIEFDDQHQGGYRRIRHCVFGPNRLVLDLDGRLGDRDDVEGFEVTLHELPDQAIGEATRMMLRIFRGVGEFELLDP